MAFRLGECLLLEILNNRGMKQAAFARKIKCSRAFVTQLINGEAFMSLEFAVNAAHLLDCKVTDFYILEIGKRRSNRNE
ncbi:helix-turn-helix domain-containing protein [Paenibacillus gorillae]|uniref:helix-turn-helix transcriptional regulator n=1 Tax=Paenibacillus gorillae TaxID=1243662 RepID=UPI0005A6F81A